MNFLSQKCKKYSSTRNMYIWAKILSYIVVRELEFMFMLMLFFKIHPACHSNANGIKPGSNQKLTDKHASEYSKTVCLDVN